ncbi:MAG TPA: hypothetical protein VK210_01540, partial [Terriglobia bacterium]|nr:hypothetical protein [Terriglobia bacterium]
MNWSIFRLLYFHEMRLLLRARRTMVLSIVFPALIMPIMLLGSKYSNDRREQALQDTNYRFAISGPLSDRIRDLIDKTRALDSKSQQKFRFTEVRIDDPGKALEANDIQFYIRTQTGAESDTALNPPKDRLP